LKQLLSILILLIAGCGTAKPNVEIICFGDSATAGAVDPAYPEQLSTIMGLMADQVENAGESGETTEKGLERLNGLISANVYPNAATFIYWQGGNDITDFVQGIDPFLIFSPNDPAYPFINQLNIVLDEVMQNIDSVVEKAQGAGWTVYVCNYYPILELGIQSLNCPASPFGMITEAQAKVVNGYQSFLNDAIQSVAVANGVEIVDINSLGPVLQSDTSRWHNCNHLNSIGNLLVAQKVMGVLFP